MLLLVCALTGLAVFVWWLWCEDAGLPTSRLPERHGRLVPQERVLFVCTHNSARSQMGEAILRQLGGSRFYVASAGTRPTMVNPLTLQVMGERALDLSGHRSKSIAEVGTHWDYVITVCDAAYEQCPDFPVKTSRLHWSVPDPAMTPGSEGDQLQSFRRVRDELHQRIRHWLDDRGIAVASGDPATWP